MATILTVSYDPRLLATRDAILQRAGYRTISAAKDDVLQKIRAGGYELVVVCYSVPIPEQREIIREVRKCNTTPVLLLRAGAIGGTPRNNQTVAIQYNPVIFLSTVQRLVGGTTPT